MNLSTFIQIINPDFFSGVEVFKKQMTFTIEKAKNNRPIAGKNIFIPGERAYKNRLNSLKNGINISNTTKLTLKKISKQFDVNFNC